jgi:small subunit ribosomal protein S5
MVIGDRKGRVGVGLGKSTDTSLAIDKAVRQAKKNMIRLKLTEDMSIPHMLHAKYSASQLEIRPAPGRGLVAGSSVRDVLELGGVKNVSSKLLSRSKNKINNARAAIKALSAIAETK